MAEPYTWIKGAAWLFPDGTLEIVPGFHDEWIAAHKDAAPDCANVADVVMKLGWISVVAYSKGYVEFIIRSRKDEKSVFVCVEHLRRNLKVWTNALIITMDEECYIKLTHSDFNTGAAPEKKISQQKTL